MKNNEQRILKAAKEAAADRATITVHVGDKAHRAIRVTGCFSQDAREICNDILAAIDPLVFQGREYPSIVVRGQDALVWWR